MLQIARVSAPGDRPFVALVDGARALALSKVLPGYQGDDSGSLIHRWNEFAPALRSLVQRAATAAEVEAQGVPMDALHIHAPLSPTSVYCTIGNYRDQVLQATLDAAGGPNANGAEALRLQTLAAIDRRRTEGMPYICFKGSACVAGPYDDLHLDDDCTTLDWEVELGVVIGRPAWRLSREDALHAVAAYCVVNDLTLRDRVFRPDLPAMGTDWIRSKSRPGWLPCGPWLVPAWSVPTPDKLRLRLELNGSVMQDGCTSDMIFDVASQISWLSHQTPLVAGDLLCTGSPAGFGSHHGRYLRPGDRLVASIEGLGEQRVTCTSERAE